jgi:hypothetical protein
VGGPATSSRGKGSIGKKEKNHQIETQIFRKALYIFHYLGTFWFGSRKALKRICVTMSAFARPHCHANPFIKD